MVDHVYGNGTNSTSGANTTLHFYEKAGLKQATATKVYGQFADARSTPTKHGKTFKVSKWLNMYDREVGDAAFASKGYISSRNVVDVTDGLEKTDGSGSALSEGSGATNKRLIKKVTIETSLARYGNMIDYTDEVDLFSEDHINIHYYELLGGLANQVTEDLIQIDMLGTPNVMYTGTATSMITVGADSVAGDGTTDSLSTVSYNTIRRAVRRLVRNRAERNTHMVTGSTKVDTKLINKSFYAIIGPEVKYDLETAVRGDVATNGATEYVYIPAYKYGTMDNLAEGEVGTLQDVRFIESETAMAYAGAGAEVGGYTGNLAHTVLDAAAATKLNAQTAGGYASGEDRFDVLPILFPTKGSFATVGLQGNKKIVFNKKAPSDISLDNPYGTQGFFSYNMWYSGIVLREERLLKILVPVTA